MTPEILDERVNPSGLCYLFDLIGEADFAAIVTTIVLFAIGTSTNAFGREHRLFCMAVFSFQLAVVLSWMFTLQAELFEK